MSSNEKNHGQLYAVKQLIIGKHLFCKIDEFKKIAKMSLNQINSSQNGDIKKKAKYCSFQLILSFLQYTK